MVYFAVPGHVLAEDAAPKEATRAKNLKKAMRETIFGGLFVKRRSFEGRSQASKRQIWLHRKLFPTCPNQSNFVILVLVDLFVSQLFVIFVARLSSLL